MMSNRTIDSDLLKKILDVDVSPVSFSAIGDIHSNHSNNLLTYLKEKKYIEFVLNNKFIRGVICTQEVANLLPDRIFKVIHDDPNYAFFSIVDYFGNSNIGDFDSVIRSPVDYSNITISKKNVKIGENVIIEPNVTIHPGVVIEKNVILRSGCVIGLDTFQHQKTSKGIISPKHDGILHINSGCEIGANSTLSRGFSYRNTIIGNHCKLDAQVYVGHGTVIEDNVLVCAGARIMGHVRICEHAFIGPSSSVSSRIHIGSNARVSIGSVVTKNVEPDSVVSGNFAVPHDKFIQFMKAQVE